MTVAEFIEKLSKMPQNAEVQYYDGDNGWTEPSVEFGKFPVCIYNPHSNETWVGVNISGG